MLDHVTIRVSDPRASERFYDTVFDVLGIARSGSAGEFGDGCEEYAQWGEFTLAAGPPVTTRLHIGFSASSRDQVDAFWQTGVNAGYRSDGEPGMRTQYGPDYYGGFLLDPDGNSIEAVHHGGLTREGIIDHMWIRVPDLAATVAFYERLATFTGAPKLWEHPDRIHFGHPGRTFALVDDESASENVHLAFRTDSDDVVNAFHEAATAAGYRDNGGPGERPRYHAGYYAAFVFDPAGNNIEVVNHNRA